MSVRRLRGYGFRGERFGRAEAGPNAIVVIHLRSNGFVQFWDLDKLMRDLKRRPRVVLVAVRLPKKWEKSANDAFRFVAKRYRNPAIAARSPIDTGSRRGPESSSMGPYVAQGHEARFAHGRAEALLSRPSIPRAVAAAASAPERPQVTVIGDSVQASFGLAPSAVRLVAGSRSARRRADLSPSHCAELLPSRLDTRRGSCSDRASGRRARGRRRDERR